MSRDAFACGGIQIEALVAASSQSGDLGALLAIDPGTVSFTRQLQEALPLIQNVLRQDLSAALSALATGAGILRPVLANVPAALTAFGAVTNASKALALASLCSTIRSGLSPGGAGAEGLSAAASLSAPPLRIVEAVGALGVAVTVAPGEVLCVPCVSSALDALWNAVSEARTFVAAAQAVVQGLPALLPAVTAAVTSVARVSQLAPVLGSATSAMAAVQGAANGAPSLALSSVSPAAAVVQSVVRASAELSDASERCGSVSSRIDRVLTVAGSQAAFTSRLVNVAASGPGQLLAFLRAFVAFGVRVEALLDSNALLTVTSAMQPAFLSAFDKAFAVVQKLEGGLHRAQDALHAVSNAIVRIKGTVDAVRDKLLVAVRVVEGDPGPLLPLPTCKNTTSTTPPCLHPVHRTREPIREVLFPLNFPILVRSMSPYRQGATPSCIQLA